MISDTLISIACYAIVAVAYAGAVGRLGAGHLRRRQIVVGTVLGCGALVCLLAQRYAGHLAAVSDGIAAVGLAAAFGGELAAVLAAIIGGTSAALLDSSYGYIGLAQVWLAALIGVGATFALQRRRAGFATTELGILAVCQTLGAAALILPWPQFRGVAAETVWVLGSKVLLGTIVLGALLQRWGDAEAGIWDIRRRLEALISNVPGAVAKVAVSPAGELRFSFTPADSIRIFGEGVSASSGETARVLQSIHQDDRAGFRRSLVEASRSGFVWSHEFRVAVPGGKQRWLHGRGRGHLGKGGETVWDVVLTNITSRKEVEQALRRSEELNRILAENTMEVISRVGPDQAWLYISPASRDILGYETDELVGRSSLSIVDQPDAARVAEALAGLVPDGAARSVIYRVRRGDGVTTWVEDTRRMVSRRMGDQAESISIIRPVEANRVAIRPNGADEGHAPHERDRRLLRLLEAAGTGVILIDPYQPNHPITYANKSAAAITGYSQAELCNRTWRTLQASNSDPAVMHGIEDAIAERRALSATFVSRRKDGGTCWLMLDLSPVRRPDGHVESCLGIFFDVSEQKRLEDDLRRSRDAAEEATRAKSDLIASISHELRTPLNGVIGFTNLLLNENLPAEQRRYATFAHDAGSSLLAIINNILDLSKMEAGKLTLVETDFSIVELAVSCNTVVWHAARERGLDLNFVLKPEVVNFVRGDPGRIRQVLLNLLSNAIKYTEKGSVVLAIAKVKDLAKGAVLRFSVTDTGIGIDKEQQSRLFQKFSQVEDRNGIYLRGTGLGLAICKTLVENMGGQIGVISTPGLGSQFWFTLPLEFAVGDGHPEQRSKAAGSGAKILLVEDAPMNQELMLTLLRRAGHTVDVVGDGQGAIEAARMLAFDLVLMDVQLPRMDGMTATRAIRQLEGAGSRVPIIAMTARALAGDAEKCLAAGMNDHLSKPVDPAALLAMIDRWAGRQGGEAQPRERSAPAVQDLQVLKDLEAHLGRAKLDDLLARARRELPRLLERINENRSEPQLLERSAHELLSVAGTAGLLELVERSRATMETCRSGSEAELAESVAALNKAGRRALEAIGADVSAADSAVD